MDTQKILGPGWLFRRGAKIYYPALNARSIGAKLDKSVLYSKYNTFLPNSC